MEVRDEENHSLVHGAVQSKSTEVLPTRGKRKRCCLTLFGLLVFLVVILLVVLRLSNENGDAGLHTDDEQNELSDLVTPAESNPDVALTALEEGALNGKSENLTEIIATEEAEEQTNELTVQYFADKCAREKKKNLAPDSLAYKIAAADCGWGYDFMNSSSKHKPWRVYLFGSAWTRPVIDLSGCPVDGRCALSPLCEVKAGTDSRKLSSSDVVVIYQADADVLLDHIHVKHKRRYTVLHYREAHLSKVSLASQKMFSFAMNVHFYSELINPAFMRTPSQLMSGSLPPFPPLPFIPVEQRTRFAMSAISDCNAKSLRDQYLNTLENVLGKERVHRYGKCGTRGMPKKPINNAAKLIAEYKFFFAFENTIQEGYISEKLFFILNIPTVPVYYGARNAPNVTKTPSYIRADDFKSPSALAHYLLHLDKNPDEYNRFHAWRKDASLFDEEYLHALTFKSAGPEEISKYPKQDYKRYPRAAACCRLCDERFVQWAAAERERTWPKGAITTMSAGEIESRFFHN